MIDVTGAGSRNDAHRVQLRLVNRAFERYVRYRRGRNEKNESRTVFENLKAAFLESLTHTFKDKCVTSDHRVAGSSPATCKTSMVKDHRAIWRYKNKTIKSAVIRLLSGFPVLLASLTAHVRINPRNFQATRIGPV